MYYKDRILSKVKGTDNEYMIKDLDNIVIGRVFILELSKENKNCTFRVKFYREGEYYEYLTRALDVLLNILFANMNLYKVNVLVNEEIKLDIFTSKGFELEGIFTENEIINNIYADELVFGLDKNKYNKSGINNVLKLNGEKISLKLLTPDKAEELLNYYSKNKKYLEPFEPKRDESFYTLKVQKQNLIDSYKQYLNGTSADFGIYKDNAFIGKIRISNIIMGVFKSAFIGYSVDEEHQNKGYMREAISLVCSYAFQEMELHRIEASTLVENEKSQRVLTACGFKKIGLCERYLYINSKWRDHFIFYKVKENL